MRGNAACGGNLVQILVARDLRERASIFRGFRDAAIDDAVKMTLEVGPLSRAFADQPDDIRARASAAVRAVPLYVRRVFD